MSDLDYTLGAGMFTANGGTRLPKLLDNTAPPGDMERNNNALPQVINEEFLTCKICFEIFDKPKILGCLHSFCCQCLERHAARNELLGVMPCPLCRQTTPIPNGIQDLKDNFFIANLQEAMTLSSCSSDQLVCDSCSTRGESKPSRMKCLDCNELLCDQCIEAHQRLNLTKNHKMMQMVVDRELPAGCSSARQETTPTGEITRTKTGTSSRSRGPRCKHHKDEECKLYCERCKVVICVTCKLTTHDGHRCCGLRQAAHQERDNLAKMLTLVRTRIEEYEQILQEWRQYRSDLSRQKQALQATIDKRRQELHTLVDGWHYAMSQQLDATYNEEKKHVGSKLDLVEVHLETNKSMCGLVENILDNARELHILNLKDELVSDLAKLQRENLNAMCLTQKTILSFDLTNQSLNFDIFGSFVLSHEKVLSSRSLKPVQCITFAGEFQTRADRSKSRYDASAISVGPNDEIIVTDRHQDRISVFENSGDQLYDIPAAMMGKPISTVALPTGDMVFTRDKQSMCVFDKHHRHKCTIKEHLSKPCSLTTGPDSSFYVLDYDQKVVTKFCSQSYVKLSHIKVQHKKSSIWDKIAINSQGNLYLSSCGQNCIYEFTATGERLAQYGRWGSTDAGDLYWPRGMCIDAHDNLIVADTNNDRLQRLSPRGSWTLLQTPEEHSLKSPTDVAVDSHGQLYVLEKCGTVHVFEYQPY